MDERVEPVDTVNSKNVVAAQTRDSRPTPTGVWEEITDAVNFNLSRHVKY